MRYKTVIVCQKAQLYLHFLKSGLKRTDFPELNEVIIQGWEKVKETFNWNDRTNDYISIHIPLYIVL